MVVEGEVEFEIEGETYRLPPGEEVLVSVGSKHTARNSGKTESRWLYGYKR